jgi:hypothetical protein
MQKLGADSVAPHTIGPETGGLLGALPTERVRVRRVDRVGSCLFRGLLVPFVGHIAIVADMHIPPGKNRYAANAR